MGLGHLGQVETRRRATDFPCCIRDKKMSIVFEMVMRSSQSVPLHLRRFHSNFNICFGFDVRWLLRAFLSLSHRLKPFACISNCFGFDTQECNHPDFSLLYYHLNLLKSHQTITNNKRESTMRTPYS